MNSLYCVTYGLSQRFAEDTIVQLPGEDGRRSGTKNQARQNHLLAGRKGLVGPQEVDAQRWHCV